MRKFVGGVGKNRIQMHDADIRCKLPKIRMCAKTSNMEFTKIECVIERN